MTLIIFQVRSLLHNLLRNLLRNLLLNRLLHNLLRNLLLNRHNIHSLHNQIVNRIYITGIGFNLTDDGNFDLDGKRLTDVADPVDNGDAATKGYVNTINSQQNIVINSKAEKTDVILRDGSQSMNANLNLNNKEITDLENGTADSDAVNFSQLKSHTDSHQNNYHLQKSFTFSKNFGEHN